MRIEITIESKTYKSKSTDEISQKDTAEELYKKLENFNKLQFDLDDGGILLIGQDAIRKAQIVIYP